jgi:predicted AlkP superfamily pyrophosphatase or phosphodiesterase
MKKSILATALFIAIAAIATAQQAKYVVIISIDGFRPDFYKDASWNMENLRQLKENGAYAEGVQGVFPSVTYPSHTTIMTGALPIRHGIYYNTYFEPWDTQGRWYWNNSEIKVPTLWDAVKKAGMTSAAISWPVTVGAPITYNIPETWTWPGTKNRLEMSSKLATPPGLFEELQANATGKLSENDFNTDYLSGDENSARMTAYLIRQYKPNLVAVHLACVDHMEHEQGRDGNKVRLAVAGADRAVKTILEGIEKAGIKDSTTVIILGDHGFSDIHTSLQPNIWLRDNGYTTQSQTGSKENWKAMFHQSGGAAFLYLKNKNDKETLSKVRTMLANLPAAQKKLFRIIERKELDSVGSCPPEVGLALAAVKGVTFGNTDKGKEAVRPATGGTHGYFPDFQEIQTGFIGYGAGIKKGAVLPVMGLQDMAPIVANLLGLSFEAPDGILYPGIIAGKKE